MKLYMKLIFAAVLAVLLILAFSQLDGRELLASVRQLPLWLVLALPVLQILSMLLTNLQWVMITKHAGYPLTYGRMLNINSQGWVADALSAKIGGDLARCVQIRRNANCSLEQAAAIVAMQKLFSLCILAIGLSGMVLSGRRILFILPILFLLIIIVVIVVKKYRGIEPRYAWMRRFKGFVARLLTQINTLRKQPRVWMPLAALSLCIWALYPFMLYLLVPELSPITAVVIAFSGYLIALLPIPGGFEGLTIGLLLAASIPINQAAIVMFIFRFVTFWLPMLLGLLFVLIYRLVTNRK